jgi:dipeptidyl-peptidase-4
MHSPVRTLALGLVLAAAAPLAPALALQAAAQQAAAPTAAATSTRPLSLERIFASSDFRTRGLPAVRWMSDGQRYTFVRAAESGRGTDLIVEDAKSGERRTLIEAARLVPAGATEPIAIEGYQWSGDEQKLLIFTNTQPVWRYNTKGTYYVYDLASGRLQPVSTKPGWQMFAKFSPDGSKVGFVRENNLFVTDLASGAETQLTKDGSEKIINGTFDWVYEEELGLRDGWRWSPDGRRIAFWQLNQADIQPFYMIDDLKSPYSELVPLPYPKAGEPNSEVRIGTIDVASGQITWMDTGAEKDIYLARMEWAASPNELVIQRMNRHQNKIDVLLADAATGRSRALFAETDPAWVDVTNDLTWVNGGKQFLWTSERDGYNHLYLYNRSGKLARQLTRGKWDVMSLVGVDEKSGVVYFTATEAGPTQRQLYRVGLNGRGFRKVSSEGGSHSVAMSPAGTFYIDTYSNAATPPVVRLHSADGKAVRVLAENERVAQAVAQTGAQAPEFFRFKTPDGVELNGWMLKPADFDPAKKYPVLMYVYGGPGSQTVTDSWGGTRYLWHALLAQKGYIVASIDNRGTGGRGRDFKKVTYLKLGDYETRDQISGARYLASLPYVDAGRVGIWGWSYGGYMTALALTQGPDVFKAGISVAPVTDWRLYDNIYTERFMRTPAENEAGYRDGSPLTHAAKLEGNLLLIHGTADDNVHFQNAVQLVDALQKAGKQFDVMFYPNKNHGISGGNTSMHLYTLMTEWLERNL